MRVELTEGGYLHMSAAMADRFPAGTAMVLVRDGELWLLPVSHPGAGGLLLKVRNASGDRSLLVHEFLPADVLPGPREAVWDEGLHAWRIPLVSRAGRRDGEPRRRLRPQPLGVFPGLAGFFLLPPVPGGGALTAPLLQGRLPEPLPEAWRFFAAAVSGAGEEEIVRLLPDGPEGEFNRFVVTGREEDYRRARAAADGDVALLLEAVAWRLGLRDVPPDGDADGEMGAFLLATRAYASFQEQNWREGLHRLRAAADAARDVSPVFCARLLAEWAATRQMTDGPGEDVAEAYREALALLAPTPFREAEAELWFQLGTVQQGMGDGQAIRSYHEALRRYRKADHPEAYALTHMNLALAYLAMPGDARGKQWRTALAIQSLREALTVFRKETHPQYWASATVNLANALQHVPSSHPEENLWEAVALYEEVLTVRREEDDPLAYARVLANQGNALAHLGAFSRAVPRLETARRLFLLHGEAAAAEAVGDVLAEIARNSGQRA